MGKLLATIQL